MNECSIKFKLDEVMKQKGLSINKVSKISGISRPYVSQLRSGAYANPTIYIVSTLARALNISIDELIEVREG